MKLILKNFRCFVNLTLDLPDKGMVLLWGNSGIGKSTLLKAIHFVLFGKEVRVVRTGEKKCSVTLLWTLDPYGTWEFCRTKGPTHFRLTTPEGSFEDDVAQQMVHNRFGDYFILTNYIAQKSVNSFFGLSNTEKTSFLHHLTIQQFDVENLKMRLRNKIKDRRTGMTSVASEVQTYQKMLDQESRIEAPIFPLKLITSAGSSDDQIQATLDEERERRTKNADKLLQLATQEKELQTAQMAYEQSRPLLIQARDTLAQKEQQRQHEQEHLPDETDTQEIETAQRQDESRLKVIRAYLEHVKAVERYQTKRQDILEHLEEQLTQKHTLLQSLPEYSEQDSKKLQQWLRELQIRQRLLSSINGWLQEMEERSCASIEEARSALSQQLASLQAELQEFDTTSDKGMATTLEIDLAALKKKIDDLDTQLKGQRLACPSCRVNVLLRHQCLVPFDEKKAHLERQELTNEVKKKKKELDTWTQAIQQKEENADDVKKDIQSVRSWIQQLASLSDLPSSIPSEAEIQTQLQQITSILEQRKQCQTDLRQLETQLRQLDQHPQLVKLATPPMPCPVECQHAPEREEIETRIESMVTQIGLRQSKIQELRLLQTQRREGLERIRRIDRELLQAQQQIQTYDSYVSREDDLRAIRDQIRSKQEKADKFEKRQKRVQEYQVLRDQYERQQKWVRQLSEAQARERIAQRALEKAEQLIECVQQAENITLETCLDRLNAEVEDYLSHFFPDTDFQMSLFSYRETKEGDKKSCIDIRIHRDGELFPMDCLSGGQFDLMCLALFLAFNKVSNQEMIMLDECLSSLHSDAVEDIIEVVKERYKDRLILFTLHQANTGLFDHVIDVHQLQGT